MFNILNKLWFNSLDEISFSALNSGMLKKDVLELFDNNGAELGRAVNLSRSMISLWPDELEQREADLVIGACVRLGIPINSLLPPKKKTRQQSQPTI
jgi:hypothetical protein